MAWISEGDLHHEILGYAKSLPRFNQEGLEVDTCHVSRVRSRDRVPRQSRRQELFYSLQISTRQVERFWKNSPSLNLMSRQGLLPSRRVST